MKNMLILSVAAIYCGGCSFSQTPQQVLLTEKIVEADKEVKLEIIKRSLCPSCTDGKTSTKNGNKLSRRSKLPPAQGGGDGPGCDELCADNCDAQCMYECPDEFATICMEPDSDFNWGEREGGEPLNHEETGRQIAKNESGGNGNIQTNIHGTGNTVTINGANESDPIKQAMAALLLREVNLPLSPFEAGMNQVRGLLNDTTDNAVKLGPSLLTGAAIFTAGDVVKKGLEETGPRLQDSLNQVDHSDRSVHYSSGAAE